MLRRAAHSDANRNRLVSRRGGLLRFGLAAAVFAASMGILAPASASPGALGSFDRLSSFALGVGTPVRPQPNSAPRAAETPPNPTGAASAAPSPSDLCDQAIARAAQRHGVAERLLRSIALVESGRTQNGERRAWPWTVNMEGKGRWFDSRAEALTYVRGAQTKGAKSFDLGCMQVNHYWHGHAFSSLEEMIEPEANADYAARYLSALAAETGDWMRAAGYYHSRSPEPFARYSALISQAYESAAARQATSIRDDQIATFAPPPEPTPNGPRYRGLLRLTAPPVEPSEPDAPRSILIGLPAAAPSHSAAAPGGVAIGAFARSSAGPLLAPARRPLMGARPAN